MRKKVVKKKSKAGGYRPGAGAPSLPDSEKLKPVSYRLSHEHIATVKAISAQFQCSDSAAVRSAIELFAERALVNHES